MVFIAYRTRLCVCERANHVERFDRQTDCETRMHKEKHSAVRTCEWIMSKVAGRALSFSLSSSHLHLIVCGFVSIDRSMKTLAFDSILIKVGRQSIERRVLCVYLTIECNIQRLLIDRIDMADEVPATHTDLFLCSILMRKIARKKRQTRTFGNDTKAINYNLMSRLPQPINAIVIEIEIIMLMMMIIAVIWMQLLADRERERGWCGR